MRVKKEKEQASSVTNVEGLKRFKGRREFLEHMAGKSIPASAAIKAYCYCCMSEYADGVGDCGDKNCVLHPFMPYNADKKKRRVLTPEHIAAMKAGRKKVK